MKTKVILLIAILMVLGLSAQASALLANGNIGITVNENGVGILNGFTASPLVENSLLLNDPGPGGLSNVLTYDLFNPPQLVAGDVLLMDDNGAISDVIRFNPQQTFPGGGIGTLVFYSDSVDGVDSDADTAAFPELFYTNIVRIAEIGTEANNGAFYTPLPGQPGFVAGAAAPVEYTFISDGTGPSTVPEPSTLLLLGAGLAGLGFMRNRFNK